MQTCPPDSPASARERIPDGALRQPVRRLRILAFALAVAGAPAAQAQWLAPGDQLRMSYGPAAYHFEPSDEHVNANHLVAAELLTSRWTRWGAERAIAGFALFDNSFGQFSQYLYVGLEWDLARVAGGDVYANATVGLLHGYKEPYEDKIPFNDLGIAPVIIPTLGWRHGRFALSVSLLGGNGLLGAIAWTFDLPSK
jgi:hypothetical protein